MNPHVSQARALLAANRPREALEIVSRGLANMPDDDVLRCEQARCYLALHQPADALEAATAATRLAPDTEWPHRLRSIALAELRRPKQAIAAAREAVRVAPSSSDAHLAIADALLSGGKAKEAYGAAVAARELRPDSARVHDTVGRCLLAQRRPAEAEVEFRRALQLEPGTALSHNNLGVALARQGKKTDALDAFTAAAKIDPSIEVTRKNVYQTTGVLMGGGLGAVIGLALIARYMAHMGVISAIFALVLIAVLVWLLRHNAPVGVQQLPPAAVAYYRSESRRQKRAARPITLVRLGTIPVIAGMLGLSYVFDSALLMLLALPVAAVWWYSSPAIWRRISGRRA